MTQRPVRFVLLSHHHSGEEVLRRGLAQHPQVRMYGELFHASPDERQRAVGPDGARYELGDEGSAYLQRTLSGPGGCELAVGFVMAYANARADRFMLTAWDYLIQDTDIRVLHLTRRNLLEYQVAMEVAHRTEGWFDPLDHDVAYQVEPFSLPTGACRQEFDRLVTLGLWVKQAFARHRVLNIEYEQDIVANPRRALSRICNFIGVDPAAPQVKSWTPSPRPGPNPAKQLINFEELREDFRYTPYESLFEPDPAGAP